MHAPRRPNPRLLVALVVTGGLLAGGWSVLRDSGVVAVKEVEVTGASGSQGEAIRSALITAGRDMTTLHVRPDVLKTAVAPYAVVKAVAAEADFPHGLRVRVTEHVPVAKVVAPQGGAPVAADGTVLRGTTADDVPELKLRLPPAGDRIVDRRTLQTITLLARAPAPLRRKVTTAFRGRQGLTVHLESGPSVHFGSSQRMTAKWASLTAVLASRSSRGATTIDVRVPEHPAAAGLEQESIQRGQPST
jgi:cell division protein FtsQ